jgi:hypothetical protein
VVVDLTIGHDPCRVVGIGQWLLSAADINDGQSLMAQPGRAQGQYPGIVRPPVLQPVEHPLTLAAVYLAESRDDPAPCDITYPASH